MTFAEACIPYTDEDGLVLEAPNSSPGPDTGNGIRNLCTKVVIQHLRREFSVKDVDAFVQILRSCQVQSYSDYPPQPITGLYNRGPRKPGELIDPDDYRALMCASAIVGAPFAGEILAYGRSRWWSFNNLDPGKWTLHSCLARQADFIPMTKACAGKGTGWLGSEIMALATYFNGKSRDAGAVTLGWLAVEALSGRSFAVDQAIIGWRQRVDHRWGSVAGAMEEYYGRTHPFTLYCPA